MPKAIVAHVELGLGLSRGSFQLNHGRPMSSNSVFANVSASTPRNVLSRDINPGLISPGAKSLQLAFRKRRAINHLAFSGTEQKSTTSAFPEDTNISRTVEKKLSVPMQRPSTTGALRNNTFRLTPRTPSCKTHREFLSRQSNLTDDLRDLTPEEPILGLRSPAEMRGKGHRTPRLLG